MYDLFFLILQYPEKGWLEINATLTPSTCSCYRTRDLHLDLPKRSGVASVLHEMN